MHPVFRLSYFGSGLIEVDQDSLPWHLVGHSMGGSVVGAMAVRNPQRVAGLVFLDALFIGTRESGKKWRKFIFGSPKMRNWLETAGKLYFFKYKPFRKILADAYGQLPDSASTLGYLTPLKQKKTASGILDMLAYAEPVFSFTEVPIKKTPLIIWGEEDTWVPLERGRKLENRFPGSELKIIENAGHCPNETHAKAFNRLVLGYLENF
jgi:pimeloyl-ACP methyl ester carboxylesterase